MDSYARFWSATSVPLIIKFAGLGGGVPAADSDLHPLLDRAPSQRAPPVAGQGSYSGKRYTMCHRERKCSGRCKERGSHGPEQQKQVWKLVVIVRCMLEYTHPNGLCGYTMKQKLDLC